jgi:hypothetical protein
LISAWRSAKLHQPGLVHKTRSFVALPCCTLAGEEASESLDVKTNNIANKTVTLLQLQ